MDYTKLKGMAVSVDVSTGEHDSDRRVFARLTGERNDSSILLAELESANFNLGYAWQPIESAPAGVNVLVFYRNKLNKGRIVKACYIGHRTVYAYDVSLVDDDFAEYDEEQDEYFIPEGWYESIDNWDDVSSAKIYHGVPTHWMHLPKEPLSDC